MKYIIIPGIIAIVSILGYFGMKYFSPSQKPEGAGSVKSIYDYSYRSIDGNEVKLSAFRGKKILFVNVASKCGFTPQYDDLEKLYEEQKDGLAVVGFPANDFMGQEPGSNEEIASFCRLTYGVTFPMSEKISVVGEGKHPIYRWLTDKSLNGWNSAGPKWNFHKYLVGETGELLAVFPSTTEPGSGEILAYLR
ncbi:MAG TPA: glutathione peroxidase [Bacteroidota bacterium]|nr:glutathione peroxidase [Bacteroidota bacterium]